MEGGDFDLRAVLHLFASDPIERTLLRAQLVSPEHPLAKEFWWTMEESFRGDRMLKVSSKFQKMMLPELNVQTVERIHPALQCVPHNSIKPLQLIYNEELRKELTTLEQLCSANVFDQYRQAQTGTAMKGIAVQLHGGPGTGKTEFCYQLARSTGRNLLMLDVSQARDKYYGETEKMITGIFREYEKQIGEGGTFPILFFNEGDSIFQRRVDSDQNSGHTDNTVQTILLNELERFQGILLVTTNTPNHFDKAFERRFQFRLRFNSPGLHERILLLQNALPECKLNVLEKMAHECQFTAAELQNAIRRLHIEHLCGRKIHDRAIAVMDLLRIEKSAKPPIGFKL
jgi:ATP-dependent Clp protease ATP-binding subunit ClpA